MPKPLSKIREDIAHDFVEMYSRTNKQTRGKMPQWFFPEYLRPIDVIPFLSTSESHIIEGIKEWAKSVKKPEWKGFGGYDEGFNDALFDLTTFLDEGLTGNK